MKNPYSLVRHIHRCKIVWNKLPNMPHFLTASGSVVKELLAEEIHKCSLGIIWKNKVKGVKLTSDMADTISSNENYLMFVWQ